jgi:hypothetical protein
MEMTGEIWDKMNKEIIEITDRTVTIMYAQVGKMMEEDDGKMTSEKFLVRAADECAKCEINEEDFKTNQKYFRGMARMLKLNVTHEWKEPADDSECDRPKVGRNYLELFDILIEVWEKTMIEENPYYLLQSVRLMNVCSGKAADPMIELRRFKICQKSLAVSQNFLCIKRTQYKEDIDDRAVKLPKEI